MSTEQVDALIAHLSDINEADIRHPELGTVGGFQTVQEVKNDIAQYLLGLLSSVRDAGSALDDATLNEILIELQQLTRQIAATVGEIDKLASGDVHNQDFPARRDALLSALQERGYSFRRTFRPTRR